MTMSRQGRRDLHGGDSTATPPWHPQAHRDLWRNPGSAETRHRDKEGEVVRYLQFLGRGQ